LTLDSFIDENQSVSEVYRYVTSDQKQPVTEWMTALRDMKARKAIDRRIFRIESGNFGDHKFCRDGVWELRIDLGPGYRLYYALEATAIVLLLCGGDKRSQSADIDKACEYWLDWQHRSSQ
jgi:putative addiction module killer protein